MSKLVYRCRLGTSYGIQQRRKGILRNPNVTGNMFAQTTHVVTVPHGFVCVIKPTT